MSKIYNMKLEIIQNLKKPKWGVTEKTNKIESFLVMLIKKKERKNK